MITRTDLSEGQQAVQAAHAAIDFCFENPSRAGPWHKDSNYLIFLGVPNEDVLEAYIRKAIEKQIRFTIFREPDLDNSITAVAFEPSQETQKLVRNLPLLLKTKSINNVSIT